MRQATAAHTTDLRERDKTGEMAAQILTGQADISTMPIEYAPEFVQKYNAPICEALGITPPDGYVAIEG